MNKIILIVNITKDLEIKYTKNGKAIVEFNLAVRRDKDITDFINCVVFGIQAENLNRYQGKGSKIAVSGEYRIDIYDKTDGTRGYSHYVLANEIEYLSTKQKEEKEVVEEEKAMNNIFEEFGDMVENENLPF